MKAEERRLERDGGGELDREWSGEEIENGIESIIKLGKDSQPKQSALRVARIRAEQAKYNTNHGRWRVWERVRWRCRVAATTTTRKSGKGEGTDEKMEGEEDGGSCRFSRTDGKGRHGRSMKLGKTEFHRPLSITWRTNRSA
ncbi:unnamed protein product [Linum trigynum]|uniref:Uncharacterized protein n=1 Tax=Linum trigynum TaxID=586398 RepID=A0AAV2FWR4_9ROSI